MQVGVLTGLDPAPNLRRLMWQNAAIVGVTVGSAARLAALGAFMAEHALRPVIDRRLGSKRRRARSNTCAAGLHFGKVVIAGPTVGSFFA